MIVDFLTWIIEVGVIFVIPLVASLRVLNNPQADQVLQKRWLIHWVLVVVLQFTVYPVVALLPSGLFECVIRLAIAFALLFIHKILGNKISDLNDQFLGASSSVLGNLREVIKTQLVNFGLVQNAQTTAQSTN